MCTRAFAPPIRLPFATAVVGAMPAAERIDARAISIVFSRMTRGQPFTTEWRGEKSPHLDLARVVIQHRLAAELIVAGQVASDWSHSARFDFPELLALESGRPVLIIPHSGGSTEMSSNEVVAWKSVREAARAAFDVLPRSRIRERCKILHFISEPTIRHGPEKTRLVRRSLRTVSSGQRAHRCADVGVGGEILSRVAVEAIDPFVPGALAVAAAGARFRRCHDPRRPAHERVHSVLALTRVQSSLSTTVSWVRSSSWPPRFAPAADVPQARARGKAILSAASAVFARMLRVRRSA
jgi:hypothetical protein